MPRVGFESTIPVFEWAKTVYALDSAAIVIGTCATVVSSKYWKFLERKMCFIDIAVTVKFGFHIQF
jgi:hypothetical protein